MPKYINTSRMSITELVAYKKIEYALQQPIKCPLLGGVLIHFNKDGFFHFTHDGRGRIRKETDQRMRLNLLGDISTVIAKSQDFGAPKRVIPAQQNRYHKTIIFYELFYRFSSEKAVAVIIRQIGNGRPHYYSVRYSKGIKLPKKRP